MKNIINKIWLLLAFTAMASNVGAQLLQQGDAVITYKYGMYSNSYSTNVVSIIKAKNTSTAISGAAWANAGWYTNANWTTANLGDVFGIAIDKAANIYLSSTSIYGGSNLNKDRIYMINGSTEAISTIASQTIHPAFVGPYGNLKCTTIGPNDFMYVSDWGNGYIHCLKKIGGTWQYQTSFNPEFGRSVTNPMQNNKYVDGQLPYGLNIRKMGVTQRLYYSKMGNSYSRNYNTGMTNNYTNEIWYVELNSNGGFVTTVSPANGEHKQNIPYDLGNDLLHGITGFRYQNPIADIAFSSDGKRLLLAQQPLISLTSLGAHSSEVREFVEVSADNWIQSGNNFPTGNSYTNPSYTPYIYQTNSVGGISYSNSILFGKEIDLKCDTTVWAVSDYIFYGATPSSPSISPNPATANYTYGLMGYNSKGMPYYNGTSVINYQNVVLVDEDNDYGTDDKYHLGDVEVYNAPLECTTCACGKWLTTPSLNGEPIPGVPVMYQDAAEVSLLRNKQAAGNKLKPPATIPPGDYNSNEAPLLKNYPVQFVQGNISGRINAQYECRGCKDSAAFAWSITKNGATTPILTGTTLPVVLENFNNELKCGKYILIIKASCGGNNCDNYTIPITIICEPVGCCKAVINIGLVKSDIHALPNINTSSGFSTANLSYNINYDVPMTEIRVSVEEFRLITNSANCLNCNNRPVTWGNILRATLNGNAMTLTSATGAQPPIPTPPSNSLQADYREAVYSTGSLINPPSAALFLMLALPQVTELSCCEVSAYVCLKFTFKDAQCRECVQMVCGNIKLIPPASTGTTGNPQSISNKTTIDTKIFNIGH